MYFYLLEEIDRERDLGGDRAYLKRSAIQTPHLARSC